MVDEAEGDITISLAAEATAELAEQRYLFYDVQVITSSAVHTLTSGRCHVLLDVTRAIAIS